MPSEHALRLPRVGFGWPVSVLPEGDWQNPLYLRASNLSLGGMFVITDEPLALGTRVSLALEASGRMLDFAEGEVVWHAPTGFGVRFTYLRPRARALVEHLVARGGTGGTFARRTARWRRGLAAALTVCVAGSAWWIAHSRAKPRAPAPVAIASLPPMSVAPAPIAPAVDPARRPFPGDFQVAVPTGGISSLQIHISDDEITVAPVLHRGVIIQRVFKLPSPARLVIDVSGREPRYSWQLDGATIVKSVRVGARNHGTRIVVDLPESEKKPFRVVTPAGV